MSGPNSLIIRILCGERFQKARPGENRLGAATLFIIALGFQIFFLAQKYRPDWVEKIMGGSAIRLWFAATIAISVGVFGLFVLWRIASSKAMIILAIFAWLVLLATLFQSGVFAGDL